jgi:hypothetical protein
MYIMLKLDNTLLDELGLGGLPEDQKRAMLQHIYETLELRVGTNLVTDQQLEEFEKFIDDGGDANQAQALQWLETNLPNYKQVVNEVFEALKVEVRAMAPQLMAASAGQPAATSPVNTAGPAGAAPIPQPAMPPAPAASGYDPYAGAGAQPASADPYAYAAQQPAGNPYATPASNNGYASVPAAPISAAPPAPIMPSSVPDPFAAPAPGPVSYVPPAPAAPAPQFMPGSSDQPAPAQPTQSQPQSQPQQGGGYPFPAQQPPAGPGGYPPQPAQ